MMTTLPALSTPCTWNTFLARSTPMVLTCMWTTPSGDSLFNDHPLAHSMPGAGVVHRIIRVGLAGPRRLPVYPGERTFSRLAGMSQRCQERKFVDRTLWKVSAAPMARFRVCVYGTPAGLPRQTLFLKSQGNHLA